MSCVCEHVADDPVDTVFAYGGFGDDADPTLVVRAGAASSTGIDAITPLLLEIVVAIFWR